MHSIDEHPRLRRVPIAAGVEDWLLYAIINHFTGWPELAAECERRARAHPNFTNIHFGMYYLALARRYAWRGMRESVDEYLSRAAPYLAGRDMYKEVVEIQHILTAVVTES